VRALPVCAAVRLACALAAIGSLGCQAPSNDRDWSPNQAVLATADFNGNLVSVHNIRNTQYHTASDYTVRHYDKTFDLDKLDTVNFIVVPLPEVPGGAHAFVSFGFGGRDFVAISVEIRRTRGEEFSLARSLARPYEIMYVVGDERDLIELRSAHWLEDVYMYRLETPRAQMRALFVDMLRRANKLSEEPEFYRVVTNNCVTNLVTHINHAAPGTVPYTYQVLFPAYLDRLVYDLNLINVDRPFEQTKQDARINELAYIHRKDPDFSVKIREGDEPLVARRPR
jgi:hypothetical protein